MESKNVHVGVGGDGSGEYSRGNNPIKNSGFTAKHLRNTIRYTGVTLCSKGKFVVEDDGPIG